MFGTYKFTYGQWEINERTIPDPLSSTRRTQEFRTVSETRKSVDLDDDNHRHEMKNRNGSKGVMREDVKVVAMGDDVEGFNVGDVEWV